MATDESFFRMYEEYINRHNYKEMFAAMLSNIQSTGVKLGTVRSCLAIGPGGGEYEIEFLKHCAPNISKFLAIEPDHESVDQLRASLRTNLPGVESQVFETKLQSWEGLSDPVDLIFVFQSLYYFTVDEQKELFATMHDNWLTSGGYVAIMSASRPKAPGREEIWELLEASTPPWEDIEADMQKAGFTKVYAYEMQGKMDFTNPDESLLRFIQLHGTRSVTLDYIRNVMKELYPGGKLSDWFDAMAIFKRKQEIL